MLFDNATGATKPLSSTESQTTTLAAPQGLPTAAGSFVAVDIAADSEAYPTWKEPVRAYFRRDGGNWKLVGFERQSDKTATPRAPAKASK